jgi:cation:H+ antiporter
MDWILLGIPVGIIMLYFGSEWMVDGAKRLAFRLGVTPFVVGLTVVAFGSSAPECVTSLVSSSTPDIIIGNIVGSNIANVGLAIGLAALISPLAAKYSTIKFEMISMIVSVLIVAFMALFGYIGFIDGVILVAALFIFVYLVYIFKKDDKEGQAAYDTGEEEKDDGKSSNLVFSCIMIVVGLVVLYFGAKFFISGATDLAKIIGVSDLLIGLLVVAVGTSLPELCICLVASYRGENDLAVSNIVGSIVFNSFFALGIGALVTNVPITQSMMMFHIPVMILMTVLMYAMVRLKNNISRPMGALLVAIYVAYVVIMALNPSLTI